MRGAAYARVSPWITLIVGICAVRSCEWGQEIWAACRRHQELNGCAVTYSTGRRRTGGRDALCLHHDPAGASKTAGIVMPLNDLPPGPG